MGVFDLLRSVLGFGGSGDSKESPETTVAVETERDPNGEEAGGTSGVEVGEQDHEPSDVGHGNDAAAAGTDATASTDSMVETPDSDPETAAEPAEAGAGVTEHSGTETPAAEPAEATGPVPDEPDAEIDAEATPEAETEPDDTASEDAEPDDSPSDEAATEPVDTVSGIGSAYADRLAGADVETVEQLLEADPEALADRADISEKRIRRWQENASGD